MEVKLMNIDVSMNENGEYIITTKFGKIFDDVDSKEVQDLKNRMEEIKNNFVKSITE